MTKKIALIFTCLFAMVSMALAQSRVTGVVVSEDDGEPVVGASVMVKGTTTGTITDLDGKFTITGVPSSAKTLVVSYVGMKTQEVAIKANVKVVLASDTEVLEEVMVVAFGTQKKSAFTGSAAVVDNKSISEHVTTNVANALVGSVPGLQIRGGSGAPGAETGTMSIRGVGSIYSDTQPLIIVDGMPYDGDLNLINSSRGRAIMAIRDNRIAAESVGLNITLYKLFVFSLSAFFAGLAGVLYSHNLATLTANTNNFGYNMSISILVLVVLGGIGSIRGSVIAAIILTALPELLRGLSDYRMLIYSILLIVIMLFNASPKLVALRERLSIKKLFKKKDKTVKEANANV